MVKVAVAAVLLTAAPLCAQQTGVSHPPEMDIEANSTGAATTGVPVVAAPVLVVPAGTPATVGSAAPVDVVTPTVAVSPRATLQRRELATYDPDANIVTEESIYSPNAVSAGTVFRARLRSSIGTSTTEPGTPFHAELTQPLLHDGRVIVPAGSMLEGHVTEVRGGRRFHGPALIHLQTQSIVLPDGSRMPVHASVIDTDQFGSTRIDDEGNIVRKDHAKQMLATLSLTAGSAAAAGGILGGVPGALIGAGIGAGVSTVMWLKQDRQTQLPVDTLVVLALDAPMPIRPLVQEPNFSVQPQSTTQVPVAETPMDTAPQAFVPMN